MSLYLVVHDLVVLLVGVEEEVDHQQDDDPLGHEVDAAVQLQLPRQVLLVLVVQFEDEYVTEGHDAVGHEVQ